MSPTSPLVASISAESISLARRRPWTSLALDPLLIRSSCSEFSSYLLFCSPLELTWGLDWQCLLASSPCVSAPCWRSTEYVPQLKKRRCSGKSGLGQEWQRPGHTLRQKFWQILTGRTQRRMFPLHYSFIFLIILLIKTYQNTSRLHHQNHSQIGRPHAITCLQDPTGSLQVSRLKLSTWRHLVLRRINVLRPSTFVGSPRCVNTLQDITRCYKYLSYLSCSIICKCSMMNIMRKNIHAIHASFRRSESFGKPGTETLLRVAGASTNDRFGKYLASA